MNSELRTIIEKIKSCSILTKGPYGDSQSSNSSIDVSIEIVRGVFNALGMLPSGVVQADGVVLRYENLSVDVDNDGGILFLNGRGYIIHDGSDVGEALRVIRFFLYLVKKR